MKIELNESEQHGFGALFRRCHRWSEKHGVEVGIAEMALGAAAIAWGVHSGAIELGAGVVGTKLSGWGLGGGTAGAGIGTIGSMILGSIGVAGAYTFGIPALVLGLGATAILTLAGYGIGSAAQTLLTPTPGWAHLLAGGSPLYVGLALMIHGATRVATDERFLRLASRFANGVITLAKLTAEVIAQTKDELWAVVEDLCSDPVTAAALGVGSAAAAATAASSAATASVTVLGSHGLGALALSLGLVSVPAWPVIAGGAAGLALGLALWRGLSGHRN